MLQCFIGVLTEFIFVTNFVGIWSVPKQFIWHFLFTFLSCSLLRFYCIYLSYVLFLFIRTAVGLKGQGFTVSLIINLLLR
jgi:hypothetical protein